MFPLTYISADKTLSTIKGEDQLQVFNVVTVRTAAPFVSQTYNPRNYHLQSVMTNYSVIAKKKKGGGEGSKM